MRSDQRSRDRARMNILQHRELMADRTDSIRRAEELEARRAARAERRAAIRRRIARRAHLRERLTAVRRFFDPLGDHR